MTRAKSIDTLTQLERWLRKNNHTKTDFALAVGCHRQTVSRVNQGLPIEEAIGLRVEFVTNGAIKPAVRRRGKPELSTKPQRRK